MKNRLLPGVLTLLIAFPAAAAVEYEFRQSTRSEIQGMPSRDVEGKAVVDKSQSRVDFKKGSAYANGAYVISSDSARQLIIINPEDKTYSTIDVAGAITDLGHAPILVENLKTNARTLNDHPKIAGFPTDHVQIDTSYDMTISFGSLKIKQSVHTVIDRWTTTAFGDVSDTFLVGGPPKTGNAELDKLIDLETSKFHGLALRQVISITTSAVDRRALKSELKLTRVRKQSSELIVTAVRPVQIASSYFEIPKSFRKSDKSPAKPEEAAVESLTLEPVSH